MANPVRRYTPSDSGADKCQDVKPFPVNVQHESKSMATRPDTSVSPVENDLDGQVSGEARSAQPHDADNRKRSSQRIKALRQKLKFRNLTSSGTVRLGGVPGSAHRRKKQKPRKLKVELERQKRDAKDNTSMEPKIEASVSPSSSLPLVNALPSQTIAMLRHEVALLQRTSGLRLSSLYSREALHAVQRLDMSHFILKEVG